MKHQFFTLGLVLLSVSAAIAQNSTKMDTLSYSLGVLIATNLKSQGFTEIKTADFSQGLADVLAGKTPLIQPEQCNNVVQAHFQEQQAKMESESAGKAKANKEASRKFLEENGKKQGVVTLPSGLQYQIIKQGSGPKPKATDKVTVHYRGTLIDGTTEFDSSIKRGEPATFWVNEVIKGWTEALQLMGEGSKWRLFIPSDLAYGDRGTGRDIGPGDALIFEVELIKIN